ncbi:MAG: pseudouridine synthase [Clostridiaceae bacterium]
MEERLQKYMARCGVASRRKCEAIILQGRVSVNRKIVNELGNKVSLEDQVCVDGELLIDNEEKVYIALNKPVGYLSTVTDDRGRKTILDLVKVKQRIYPIGRLDYDSSGLILLTNDGEIYNKIIHPRVSVDKVYRVEVSGKIDENSIKILEDGVDIGGYVTKPARVELKKITKGNSTLEIIIHEGKNRQIRRMCKNVGYPVITLERVRIGQIYIDEILSGKYRKLTNEEIKYINNL